LHVGDAIETVIRREDAERNVSAMSLLAQLWPRSGLWRHKDYLRLWGAQGISAFGSQITLVALPLTAILTLDASTFQVALLTGAEFLPFVFLGIPAGVWVDRMRRRPILVLADIARGASLLSIPVAYWVDALTLPHLFAVALINGSLTVFFTLAYQAYLPELVQRAQLVEANAKFEATETIARLAGPGAGGGLVSLLTAPVAVLIDAASFFGSGALIVSIRHDEPFADRRRARPEDGVVGFWRELREGAQVSLRNTYIRATLATTALLNIGFNMAWAVLLVFAVRELDVTAGLVGLVLSVGEVGGLLGAFLATRLTHQLGVGYAILGSGALFGPSLILVGLAPSQLPLPFLALGWAAVSFANVIYNTTTVSLRQAYVPQRLQARVVGFNRTIVWGISPLGAVLGGILGTTAGLRWAIVAGGIVTLVALLPAALSPLPSLHDMPEPMEPDEPDVAGRTRNPLRRPNG
jgi:MFS family permease